MKIIITDNEGKERVNKEPDSVIYVSIKDNQVSVGFCGMTSGGVVKELKKTLPKFIKKQLEEIEVQYDKEIIKQMAIEKAKSILEDNKNGRE